MLLPERKRPRKHLPKPKRKELEYLKPIRVEVINNMQPFQGFPFTPPPQAVNWEISNVTTQGQEEIQTNVDVITNVLTDLKTDVNVITSVQTQIQNQIDVITNVQTQIQNQVDVITNVLTEVKLQLDEIAAQLNNHCNDLNKNQEKTASMKKSGNNAVDELEALAESIKHLCNQEH